MLGYLVRLYPLPIATQEHTITLAQPRQKQALKHALFIALPHPSDANPRAGRTSGGIYVFIVLLSRQFGASPWIPHVAQRLLVLAHVNAFLPRQSGRVSFDRHRIIPWSVVVNNICLRSKGLFRKEKEHPASLRQYSDCSNQTQQYLRYTRAVPSAPPGMMLFFEDILFLRL